jgi:tetratricopeptide (TPR) repeat protein
LLEPLVAVSRERDANFRAAQQELALVYERQGAVWGSLGQFKEADAALLSGLALAQDLVAADPLHHGNQLRLASMYGSRSRLQVMSGDFDAYIETSDTLTRLLEAILSRAPEDDVALTELAVSYNDRGQYLLTRDTSIESARQGLAFARKSLSLDQRLYELKPDDTSLARGVAIAHGNIGFTLNRIGDSKQAAQEHRHAIKLLSPLVAKDPSNVQFRIDQATANGSLSAALLGQGDVAGSVDSAQAALTVFESLPKGVRSDIEVRLNQGETYFTLGSALERRSASGGQKANQARTDLHEACRRYRQALNTLQELKDGTGIAPGQLQPDTVRKAMLRCPPQSRAPA